MVLRLLRGESLEALSREVGVEIYRLEEWRERAMAGLELGLKDRHGEPVAEVLDQDDQIAYLREEHRGLRASWPGGSVGSGVSVFGRVGPPSCHVCHDRWPARTVGWTRPAAYRQAVSGPRLPARGRTARPYAVVRRTRRRGDAVRGAAVPAAWGRRRAALLRGSKTDPQRPLPTDPLTTDSVRRRPTTLSHLIEDVTCEDGLRLLPRPTARSKALPDDQLVPEEGVLHTGLLMVARVLLPLSPSSLLHLSDRAVARGRSWSPSRHGGCPGRWNDDRRATRTRNLVDATRVVGRVRREAGDVAFDLVDQIEGRRRVVNMPAGQGVSDDHARSVDAQMKLLPAASTASAMFHGRPFTFTHSREPGTVDDEMYACARGEAAKCKVEVLTTP